MDKTMAEVLYDLRECAGQLRRLGKYAEADRVQAVADKLDTNEIKPAPTVYARG